MIGTMSKLVPLMAVVGAAGGGADELSRVADEMFDTVLEFKTMSEMKGIVKTVRLEMIAGEPLPDDIVEFARGMMDSQGTDPGLDAWETEWEMGRTRSGAIVLLSCGPDQQCDTEDDIQATIIDSSGRFQSKEF